MKVMTDFRHVWHRHVIDVDVVDEKHPCRSKTYHLTIAFHMSRHQEPEGENEMSHNHQNANIFPTVVHSDEIPFGLLRNVAIPNQKVLRKACVRPEDDETPHELATVVKGTSGERARKRTVALKPNAEQYEHREGANH